MRTNRWGALVALMMAVVAVQGCGSDDEGGTGMVTGTVILDDGASPEGVEIESLDTESTVFADAQGRFTLKDLKAGTQTLQAVHPGYEVQQREVEVKRGETTDVSITLKRLKHKVSGTVLLEGASSHEGITVTLEDTAFSTTTDAQGRFVFEGVVPGAYILVASKDGYEEQLKVLAVIEDTAVEPLTLPVMEEVSLDGIVYLSDDGSPVGVSLVIEGTAYSTTIDSSSGYFRFTDVPPGAYTLAVSKPGYITQTRAVTVGGEVSTYFFSLERSPGLVE
ncbi:Carboxypeptidase regulatory-like domain-containing protein [Stigmatella aurantiaca]|uniref:Carboxypeptidase regulatory-like domain-containing protein n=1 Tax=Stigmatella aurantiaca TaxID=41 RepID=A0A1H8B7D0_STIAU|nr:carboxypeptidase regulatory-like domain-containing protein [Stigmatella aurantiaca]SEM78663.1 Carboxypeptidase regulatory-like domain-containing protein [Stigmatella aurantiaca]